MYRKQYLYFKQQGDALDCEPSYAVEDVPSYTPPPSGMKATLVQQ